MEAFFYFLCVILSMSVTSHSKGGYLPAVKFSVATEVDPTTGKSVYITLIHNGTDSVIAAGVTLSASDNIILGKNATLTFDPPLKCATSETATPNTGVTMAYFISK